MRQAEQQVIAASNSDLRNNRLGLMSADQLNHLQEQIDHFQLRTAQLVKRSVGLAAIITLAVVILAFVRVLLLPIALAVEAVVVGLMIYTTTSLNSFAKQLMLDHESEAVRIVKGRTNGRSWWYHPLYHELRVELQTYKLLDQALARQFSTGELYQLYVLPHSGVIIAAEQIDEKGFRQLH